MQTHCADRISNNIKLPAATNRRPGYKAYKSNNIYLSADVVFTAAATVRLSSHPGKAAPTSACVHSGVGIQLTGSATRDVTQTCRRVKARRADAHAGTPARVRGVYLRINSKLAQRVARTPGARDAWESADGRGQDGVVNHGRITCSCIVTYLTYLIGRRTSLIHLPDRRRVTPVDGAG